MNAFFLDLLKAISSLPTIECRVRYEKFISNRKFVCIYRYTSCGWVCLHVFVGIRSPARSSRRSESKKFSVPFPCLLFELNFTPIFQLQDLEN